MCFFMKSEIKGEVRHGIGSRSLFVGYSPRLWRASIAKLRDVLFGFDLFQTKLSLGSKADFEGLLMVWPRMGIEVYQHGGRVDRHDGHASVVL